MEFIDFLRKDNLKMRILLVGILVGLGILVARLWYVQIYSSKRHWHSLRQQSYRTVRIPAPRGNILDSHGRPLAENRPSYDINLYLQEIRSEFQDESAETMARLKKDIQFRRDFLPQILSQKAQEQNAESLTNLFTKPEFRLPRNVRTQINQQTQYQAVSNLVAELGEVMGKEILVDKKKFTRHFGQSLSLPLSIMRDVPEEEMARFVESSTIPPGFYLDDQPLRFYPEGEVAAQILGHLGRKSINLEEEAIKTSYQLRDFEGRLGLEREFDEELRGKPGVKSILVSSIGYQRTESIVTPPVSGENVILTLDLDIQIAAEEALRSSSIKLDSDLEGSDEVRGSAVVLDASNGDILAMASVPSFDPNLFVPSISIDQWHSISTPEDSTRGAMMSRASYQIYQPGSIFKIITGLAMLEEEVVDPDEFHQTEWAYSIGRLRWGDTAPPGQYNFRRAFMRSSNYYFIEFGLLAGIDSIIEIGEQFHLGESLELPVPNHRGLFPDHEYIKKTRTSNGRFWTDGDTANVSIGQGELDVTVLQMAIMTAAMGNGGKVFWPRLVERIEKKLDDGKTVSIQVFPTRLRSELDVDPKNLEVIRTAMLADVNDPEGTGKRARVPGMVIGGKTGTAETEGVRKNTWFVSMSPVEAAEHVVVVMIENGESGGVTCAPIAAKIYQAIQKLEQEREVAM